MDDQNSNIPSAGSDQLITVLKFGNQNMSQLVTQLVTRFSAQCATQAVLGVSNSTAGGTQIVQGAGYLISISVTVPSTGGAGTVYDSDTIVGVGSSVAIGIIPSSGIITYNWPFTRGIVVQPSSGASYVSVSYST